MGNTNEFHIICAGTAGLDMTNRQFLCGKDFVQSFLKPLATMAKGGYYIKTWVRSHKPGRTG